MDGARVRQMRGAACRLHPAAWLLVCALGTVCLPFPLVAAPRGGPGGLRTRLRDDGSAALPAVPSHRLRRQLRAAEPGRTADTSTFWIESSPVAFGSVVPGQPARLDHALQIRVFSPRPFLLKLVAAAPLRTAGGGFAPAGRLSWRSSQSGGFVPLSAGGWGLVWRGQPTSAAGTLVDIDLRLLLEDADPLGAYVTPLRLALEPL